MKTTGTTQEAPLRSNVARDTDTRTAGRKTSVTDSHEFAKGYPVVLIAALGSAAGIGGLPVFSLPLFITPLHESLGWSRGEIGVAASILSFLIFIGSPLAGRLADRVGARRVVLTTILLQAVGMVAVSQVKGSVWWFYLAYFILGVGGMGTTYVCYSRVVTTWFRSNRGLALGIMMTGPSIVASVAPMLLSGAIRDYGWRTAWLAMSVAALLPWPFVFRFLVDGPQASKETSGRDTSLGLTFAEIRRTRQFWFLVIAGAAMSLAAIGVHTHIIGLLGNLGVTGPDAARAASLLGISMFIGRVSSGLLLDRVFAPIVGASLSLVGALGVFGTAALGLPPIFIPIVIGLVFGMESDFMAYCVTRYFGLKSYAECFGWIFGAIALGAAFSAAWVGWMHERVGSYFPGLYISSGLLILATLCVAFLGPYPKSFGGNKANDSK